MMKGRNRIDFHGYCCTIVPLVLSRIVRCLEITRFPWLGSAVFVIQRLLFIACYAASNFSHSQN